MVDATVDIGVGPFEGGVGIDWHGVGNRPVQPRKSLAELFVGVVADGDDEVIAVKDLVEGLGAVGIDAEPVALGNGDGSWVDAWAGMGAGRGSWDGAQLVPDGGGELGAGRVRRAHEHHPGTSGEVVRNAAGDGGRPDGWVVESQLDIATAAVALGPDPTDDAGILEHAEMVGEQVAAQADVGGQLAG